MDVGIKVAEGGTLVSVGVIGVADSNTGVFVAGTDVAVRGIGVAVGGMRVLVDGIGVDEAGRAVAVDGIEIAVSGTSVVVGGIAESAGLMGVYDAKIRPDNGVALCDCGFAVLTGVLVSRGTLEPLLTSICPVSILVNVDRMDSRLAPGKLEYSMYAVAPNTTTIENAIISPQARRNLSISD